MRSIWNLTAANLRKGKGQAASFLIMAMLAAMLMNMGLVSGLNYDQNFDRRARQLQSADVILTIQNTAADYLADLEKELAADARTERTEVEKALFLSGSCIYSDSTTARNFAIRRIQTNGEIGKIAYHDKTKRTVKNPIYLPYIFKTGGGYQTGDAFDLTVSTVSQGEQTCHYTVAGFFEEMMLATINSSTTGLILEDKEYRELSARFLGSLDSSIFFVQLKNSADNEAFATDHLPKVPPQTALSDTVFYDMVKQARTITSTIGSMIIVAFSIIVVVIALIVVRFRIRSSIEEDMQTIGTLKAIGYTGRQISNAIMLQFLLIGFLGTIAGIGLSYLLLPFVSQMFASQTGVIWNQGFDIRAAAITVLFVLFTVLTVSWLAVKKARRLEPIMALRSGILTHSFKRNPFPLDCRKGKLVMLLAGKEFYQNARQSVLVGLIVAAISFAAVFAGVLYVNITVNFDRFLTGVVGEIYSVRLDAANPAAAGKLLDRVEDMPQVRKAIDMAADSAVQVKGGSQIICYATEDYAQYDNQGIVYRGRFPKYENETAIGGLLAGRLGKQCGDMVTLVKNEREIEYLITGLIQGSNYLGRDAALTRAGYAKLSPEYQPTSIAVYLGGNKDIDGYIDDVKEQYGEDIVAATNYRKLIEASMGTYKDIVGILAIVIMVVTAFIIALTLFLVIKTSLLRKRQELGIHKAIGYTAWQLVWVTALSFLPVVLIGSAIGCVIGKIAVNPMLGALFSVIGVIEVNFAIPWGMLAAICVGITLFGFAISVLAALRIRKVTPYALMRE